MSERNIAKISQARLKEVLVYKRRTGIFIWRVSKGRVSKGTIAGTINNGGYRVIKIDGFLYIASRLAWLYQHGKFPTFPLQMDHINGIRSDDRLKNLRTVTPLQQAMNRRAYGASRYRGVSKVGKKWMARGSFGVGRKEIYLGIFKTKKEAARAYIAQALQLRGKFLRDRYA